MKVRISKCYLVQVVDEDGNELDYEYVFGDRKEAEASGRNLKERARQQRLWAE